MSYVLSLPKGPGLADADLPQPSVAMRMLDDVVGDLAVPRGSSAAEGLATYAVRYVAVPEPVPAWLTNALDAQSGLARVNFQGQVRVWRTLTPAARLTVVPPELNEVARGERFASRDELRLTPTEPLKSAREGADVRIPAGEPGRLLALSERAHRGWVATVDGQPLKRVTVWGWAQGFELFPAGGGVLELRHDTSRRATSLAVQGFLLLLAVVLAAPSVRRGDDEPEEDDEVPAVEPAEPENTAVPAGNVRTIA